MLLAAGGGAIIAAMEMGLLVVAMSLYIAVHVVTLAADQCLYGSGAAGWTELAVDAVWEGVLAVFTVVVVCGCGGGRRW